MRDNAYLRLGFARDLSPSTKSKMYAESAGIGGATWAARVGKGAADFVYSTLQTHESSYTMTRLTTL